MRTALLTLALALVGCGTAAPREIVLHEDQCNYCRMEISDARFGAQVITRTGKTYVFDSVECVVGFVRAAEPEMLHETWVIDSESRGGWVPAAEAGYLIDSALRGPMGRVVAFASPAAAVAARVRLGGATASWTAVLADSAGVLTPTDE